MAKTITGLTNALTSLDDADLMVADDTSAAETKKITGANLKASCQEAEEDKISFSGPIAKPSSAANKSFLYTKDVSGKAELHWEDEDGNEIQLTSAGKMVAQPAGMVASFMTTTAPVGWLECDGSAVSRTTYALLFATIATNYGVGDGSTTFNLPDLRGRFLRGWDHGATVDPDAASRTDRGDGTTGDTVGTKQADAFDAHAHYTVRDTSTSNYLNADEAIAAKGSLGNSYDLNGSSNTPDTGLSGETGGNETRPVNIAVMFCIKY